MTAPLPPAVLDAAGEGFGAVARRALWWWCGCYLPLVAFYGSCVTGLGGWRVAGAEFWLLVPVVAFFANFAALPLLASPVHRRRGLAVFVVAWVLILGFVPALWCGAWLRLLGFHWAGERAAPVVAAIERYVAVHGRPPEELAELVPRYLPELPARLPPLQVVAAGPQAAEELHGNPWGLFALVPSGLLNWDQFVYLPRQNYPERGYGGSLRRLGRWAYVHE